MEKNENESHSVSEIGGTASFSSPPCSPNRSKADSPSSSSPSTPLFTPASPTHPSPTASSPTHPSPTLSSPPPQPIPSPSPSPSLSPSPTPSPTCSSTSFSSALEDFFSCDKEERDRRSRERSRRRIRLRASGVKKTKKRKRKSEKYWISGQYVDREAFDKYAEQIKNYGGFYLKMDRPLGFLGEIIQCPIDKEVVDAAKFALDEYNKSNGLSLELKRVLRANGEAACVILYYITLEATDGSFYEAMVEVGLENDPMNLEMIRPAVYHDIL